MKRLFLLLALALMIAASNVNAGTSVSLSFSFNDALAPYGSWVHSRSYGNCWRPRVDHGWRPYSQGHWIYSSYGPMWDTSEPYGWAVYHYGKWVYDDYNGWIWVPGYDWYPSRVTWAYGDDYLGWSPMYPSPGNNVNFWLFIDRGHYGYNNYSNVYLRSDRVRPLFERRHVRVRTSNFRRDELERIVRQPVRVTPVGERFIEADRRRVRMIVPKHREATVLREVSRSHERMRAKERPAVGRTTITKKSEVTVQKNNANFNQRSKVTTLKSSKKPVLKYESKKTPQVKYESKRTYTRPDSRSVKQSGSSTKYNSSRFNSDRREITTKAPAKKSESKSYRPSERSKAPQIKYRSSERSKAPQINSKSSDRSKTSQIKYRSNNQSSKQTLRKNQVKKSSAKRSKSKPHSH